MNDVVGPESNSASLALAILRNLTPHPVTLLGASGLSITLPVDGEPPRVELVRSEPVSLDTTVGTFELRTTVRGDTIENLPPPRDGVLLIVSRLVAEAAPERGDLLFPDDTVRNKKGAVVGARGLGRLVGRTSRSGLGARP
jgi:hypothetical protein